MNLNWCYGPETVKMGFDLRDLDLWPLTVTFCMDIIFVKVNTPENFKMIWWEELVKKVSQKEGWTDGQTEVFLELLCRS